MTSIGRNTRAQVLRQRPLLAALLLLVASRATATSVVDQQQTVIDRISGGQAIGGASAQILVQTVTVGVTGLLSEIRLVAGCAARSNLVVEIQQVLPGPVPSGIVLTSETISAADLGPLPVSASTGFRSIVLSLPVPVSAGNVLAVVMKSAGACASLVGPAGNPYPGGRALFNARPNPIGVWVPYFPSAGWDDLPFQTVVSDGDPGSVPRGSDLDQRQQIIDSTVGGLAIGGAYEEVLAQVVTAGLRGRLTAVRVPVACDAGGNLIVEVQGVTGGQPNGTVFTSEGFVGTSLPSFSPPVPSFRTLAFSTPVPVTPGTQFAIVLRATGGCGIFQGPAGDPYPGGDAYFDARPNPPGVWVPLALGGRFDLPFETYVR